MLERGNDNFSAEKTDPIEGRNHQQSKSEKERAFVLKRSSVTA